MWITKSNKCGTTIDDTSRAMTNVPLAVVQVVGKSMCGLKFGHTFYDLRMSVPGQNRLCWRPVSQVRSTLDNGTQQLDV